MHIWTNLVVSAYLVALLTLIIATSILIWQLSRVSPSRVRQRIRNIAIATTALALVGGFVTLLFHEQIEVATPLMVMRSTLLFLAAAMAWGAYARSAKSIRGTGVWAFMFENVLVVVFSMTLAASLRVLWTNHHTN